MIRKAALRAGAFALFVLIGWNAYLVISHMRRSQQIAESKSANARMQQLIAAVQRDLSDMETGQRGYLLTANDDYLQPYNDARNTIANDLASLRLRLVDRPHAEQATEAQLESLAQSKQAEIERSINLRQQGYRHRAFKLIDSNEGKEYMDKARGLLASLASTESRRFQEQDARNGAQLRKAFLGTIVINLGLLALAVCLGAGVRYHGRALEREAAQTREQLALRDFQLRRLTSALSTYARDKTSAIEQNAGLLLENYGGFLPKRGQEYAEQIKEASAQMERLRQELVGNLSSRNRNAVPAEAVA
jgi:CHASE3 domain sensor protein